MSVLEPARNGPFDSETISAIRSRHRRDSYFTTRFSLGIYVHGSEEAFSYRSLICAKASFVSFIKLLLYRHFVPVKLLQIQEGKERKGMNFQFFLGAGAEPPFVPTAQRSGHS